MPWNAGTDSTIDSILNEIDHSIIKADLQLDLRIKLDELVNRRKDQFAGQRMGNIDP
jgi:hypothetical protein